MQSIRCAVCGAAGAVKRCSRCKTTHYCNARCQMDDWPAHKAVCAPPAALPSKGADVDARLTALAAINGPCRAEVVFYPRAAVCIKGETAAKALLGAVHYGLAHYTFGPALWVYDWTFTLQQVRPEVRRVVTPNTDDLTWYVAAFHAGRHYVFGAVRPAPHMDRLLLRHVFAHFWPILHPESYVGLAPDVDGGYTFEYELNESVDEAVAAYMAATGGAPLQRF